LLKKIRYLFLIILFVSNKNYSQKGDYFVSNYLPKDYLAGANNLGVTQNNDGMIFVANINGVLIFDGVNWQHCKRKDEISIQCIAKTNSGKIVVGTEDGDIALIEKDKNGKFYYASLIDNLPAKSRPQQIIRQIVVLGESTFFLSADKLIEFKNSEFKVYNPTESFHTRAFVLGKHLFVTDVNNSINVLESGVLKPVAGSQELSNEKHFFCYKINTQDYVIGYRNLGTYLAHYDSLQPTKTSFEKKESQCDKELVSAEINNGCILKNGHFVVTTNKKGAYEIDENLNIVGRFNTRNGVYDDNIKSAFQDSNGNLWLSLYYGISYVEINSKLFKYDRNNNILGIVASAAYFENKLFVATDKGVQYYDSLQEKFIVFENFNKQSWNLLNYKNKLFICTAKGLFVWNNNQIKQISESNTNSILNDPNQPDLIYCATDNGVEVYNVSQKEVTFVRSYELNSFIKSIAVDEFKNIYFASENNGIYFLNYSNAYALDSIMEVDGLPHQNIENYVFTYKNKLLVGTDDGIYILQREKDHKFVCVKDKTFWPLTKGSQVFRASQLNNDLICTQKFSIKNLDKTVESVAYFQESNRVFNLNTGILNRLKNVTPTLITYDDVNKKVFFCANEGLFILNNNNEQINFKKQFNLILREFVTKNDTVLENYISDVEKNDLRIIIPYNENDVNIKIGFTSFENSDFEFCHQLVGKDKEFSNWDKETKLFFNNLSEGNYTLIIKAKTEFSEQQFELKIPFKIEAPWYRTTLAYAVYLMFFGVFVYVIVQLNSKRLKSLNKKLELTIAERTKTISHQNKELEEKQKEIIDSINYAQRIQRALLASKKLLDNYLSQKGNGKNKGMEYFVFFQPKDIVSGDFYWASNLADNNFAIAIADSTGHGVPGAIMSMLNISCLKEAVVAQKLTEPNLILNYTRSKIIETLANDGSADGGKDGMDCSLLCFDFNAKKLNYAAANNPIWIVRKNNETSELELLEFTADKMPVGKHDRDTVSFTQHSVALQSGDMIYSFTDGLPDQFGGPRGKKFMYKQFKELLASISQLPANEQSKMLNSKLNEWKGELEQVDDVLVFGIRVA
jgi:serine phosphatase RsbU (regulator of sigma subunit)/ligand-binding sensor domain-containing protein